MHKKAQEGIPRIREVRRMSFPISAYCPYRYTNVCTFTLALSHGNKSRAEQGAP